MVDLFKALTTMMLPGSKRRYESGDDMSQLPPTKRRRPNNDGVLDEQYQKYASPACTTTIKSSRPAAEFEVISKLLMVEMQKTDEIDVADAIKTLVDWLCSNTKCETTIKEAYCLGAHSIVVQTMNKFSSVELIQLLGCSCLLSMAVCETTISAICKCGGIAAVVDAMTVFPRNDLIQTMGCFVCWNCISGLETEATAIKIVARHFVMDYDGVAIVVKAMKNFPNSGSLQIGGCGLFCNLFPRQEFRGVMLKEGVVTAVAAAAENHFDDQNVKKRASYCLYHMLAC